MGGQEGRPRCQFGGVAGTCSLAQAASSSFTLVFFMPAFFMPALNCTTYVMQWCDSLGTAYDCTLKDANDEFASLR